MREHRRERNQIMKRFFTLIFILLCAANAFSQIKTVSDSLITYDNLLKSESVFKEGAPELIGGLGSLEKKIIPPFGVILRNYYGTVLVKVLVDTSGIPSNPIIVNKILPNLGLSRDFNYEAERVVLSSRFIPSIINHKKLPSYCIVPVEFKKDFSIIDYVHTGSNCEKVFSEFDRSGGFYVESMPKVLSSPDTIKSWIKYPIEALQHGIKGIVYLKLLIDTTGIPICEKVIKGLPYGCNEAAIKAAQKIRFTPAIKLKRKIRVVVVMPIEFK